MRTKAIEGIQVGLIRGLHYGILAKKKEYKDEDMEGTKVPSRRQYFENRCIPLDDDAVSATSMPEPWVRAAMLIRLNSLAQGASGVRPLILNTLLQLLNQDIVPRVPLRGSISASGDLSPLSYIGGVMQGKPAVEAWVGRRGRDSSGRRKLVTARKALRDAGIQPIDIRAKEGLAIVNGTAVSAAVGTLALHEAMCLASLAQVLTAMSVEALLGTDESFHPFFSEVRPHPGQEECARNIKRMLEGSKLVASNDGSREFSLRQDRYAIRTAPQWIGPVLEDLGLAHSQISIEINSATDNPLIDESGKMLHGGNFQAKAVTSAMEKIRQGCQSLGQMLFAQCTELINPAMNRGLSPNIVVDEPSQSWMWKGTDIMIAALQSELGFLSNPVGTHVQFAEMGNQALNSLALVSGRYTLVAVDVLAQMAAAHLVALCQALDLRALHLRFLAEWESKFRDLTAECLDGVDDVEGKILDGLWDKLNEILAQTTHMDTPVRFANALDYLQSTILRAFPPGGAGEKVEEVQMWSSTCVKEATATYERVRDAYVASPDAGPILGKGAKKVYEYVRKSIGVPFFGEKYISAAEWIDESEAQETGAKFRSMGSMITAVYEDMRTGALYSIIADCINELE